MGSPSDERDVSEPPSPVEARAFVEGHPMSGKPQMDEAFVISLPNRSHTKKNLQLPHLIFQSLRQPLFHH